MNKLSVIHEKDYLVVPRPHDPECPVSDIPLEVQVCLVRKKDGRMFSPAEAFGCDMEASVQLHAGGDPNFLKYKGHLFVSHVAVVFGMLFEISPSKLETITQLVNAEDNIRNAIFREGN